MKTPTFIGWALLCACAPLGVDGRAETNPASEYEILTLDQAIQLAEQTHPDLEVARARIEALAGRAEQAGRFSNPELIVGAQQIALGGDAINQKEYQAGIAQSVPLNGRLGKARDAELFEQEVRRLGLDVVLQNLRKKIRGAFATALYQEMAYDTQSGIRDAIQTEVALTVARLEEGDVVPGDLAEIEMALVRAATELSRIDALKRSAMLNLKAAIGDPGLDVNALEGDLDTTFEIPALESLVAGISQHPELLRADATIKASDGWIDVARASRVPDVRIEALYHRLAITEENTVDVGVSVPLPLFNRNQGRLREAQANAWEAEADRRSTRIRLAAQLQESYGRLQSALTVKAALQNDLIPRSDTLLQSAEARFDEGDINFHELLSFRLDAARLRLSYLESLRDVMQAWVDLSAFVK